MSYNGDRLPPNTAPATADTAKSASKRLDQESEANKWIAEAVSFEPVYFWPKM